MWRIYSLLNVNLLLSNVNLLIKKNKNKNMKQQEFCVWCRWYEINLETTFVFDITLYSPVPGFPLWPQEPEPLFLESPDATKQWWLGRMTKYPSNPQPKGLQSPCFVTPPAHIKDLSKNLFHLNSLTFLLFLLQTYPMPACFSCSVR